MLFSFWLFSAYNEYTQLLAGLSQTVMQATRPCAMAICEVRSSMNEKLEMVTVELK